MPDYEMKVWQIPDGRWGWKLRVAGEADRPSYAAYVNTKKKAREAAVRVIESRRNSDAILAAETSAEWEPFDA